jgi:hypothetical protein
MKQIEKFEDRINEMSYLICDGKLNEIEILERKTIFEYYSAIAMFLKKVERMQNDSK